MILKLWITIIYFIAETAFTSFGAPGHEGVCIERKNDASQSFELICKNGVITYVNVTSGKGRCKGKAHDCTGETPTFIAETHTDCYWHSNCTLTLTNEIMVRVPPGIRNIFCLGKTPEFLRINGYRCFDLETNRVPANSGMSKTRDIIDICSQNSELKKGMAHQVGILRSHEQYPWQYSVNESDFGCDKLLYTRSNAILLVTVQDVELGEGDQLSMYKGSERATFENLTYGRTIKVDFGITNVTFVFNVSRYSNGARGFVLCYTFLEENDQLRDNACDAATTPGDISEKNPPKPEKCQKGKKGKKCRKRNKKRCKEENKTDRKKGGKHRKRNRKKNRCIE